MQVRFILLFFALLTVYTSGAQSSARKTDEYGNINRENASARIDNFAIELMMNDPGAMGYIITYGGSNSSASVAKARADFAKNYIVNTRGIDPNRIVTINGGLKKEPTTELWVVPSGAAAPLASPTVKPKANTTKVKVKKS